MSHNLAVFLSGAGVGAVIVIAAVLVWLILVGSEDS